jgi:hypothetical protein
MIRGEVLAAIRLLKYGHRVLQEFQTQQQTFPISFDFEADAIVKLVEAFFTSLTHQAVCVSHSTGVRIY